jgi:HPt (histidine-containing phosphotransfer) domain-containing protein
MLVNASTVTELREMVGDEAVTEIAEAMRQTLKDFITELPGLSDDGLAARAHSLKGSTAYLGTEELNAAAIKADSLAKEGGDVRGALQELADLIEPTLAELDKVMAA